MSGPGGPASVTTTMIPPMAGAKPPAEIKRIKDNLYKILTTGGTESDADEYLKVEGVTADEIKNSPVARTGAITSATPVASAYKPTNEQRSKDLLRGQQTGTKAPALPNNAPIWQRAMDWMDTLGASADTAARGFTFGLQDEAAGAGAAAGAALKGGDAGEAFKQGSAGLNARVAKFKEANPLLGYGVEGVGMIASPLSRIGSDWQMSGPNMISRALRSGVVGAGQGALTAAAYDDGDLASRLKAGAWGGAIGGPVGFIAAPAIETATRGAQTFMDTYRARQAAANDPAARARAMVAQAIARDQMTPVPQQGEALVSAGGPNMRALGRQATVAPGNARATAAGYFAGAADDMPDAIGQSIQANVSGDRLLPTLEGLDRQQRAASGPAYDAFYALSPDAFDTPYFRNLMGGSVGRRIIQGAYDLGEIERAAGHMPDNPMQYLLDAEGNVSVNQAPSPRAVDLMKRAIDQQVVNNTNQVTGKIVGAEGNSWERLRRSFVANADTASTVDGVPLFKVARDAYAGPAQLKDAANAGAKALTGNQLTSQKAQAFTDLSTSEQQAFRTGLAEALIEKAGKMGPNTDPVQLFLKGRNAQDLMRTYLPDQQSFDSFVQTLQQQSRIVKASRAVMGGSPTAPRIAENADAAMQEQALTDQLSMARDAWNLATGRGGGRVSAAVNIYNRGRNAVTGVSEPVADELGRMLFNPDAPANLATVRGVSAQVPQIQANQAAQDWLRRYAATYGTLPMVPVAAGIGAY